MNKQNISNLFINLYMVVAIVHVFMMSAGNDLVETITKCALMPLLWLYAISAAGFSRQMVFISLALLFSWAGDIMLLDTWTNAFFFLGGLGAFLIAHIFYIISFLKLTDETPIVFRWKYAAPFIVFTFLLLGYLYSALGDMKLPVIIYGVAICMMGIAALHRSGRTVIYSFRFVLTGAILFIISDSIIAINKFQQPFAAASLLIMTTYIAAQYLIISGCVLHIKEKGPQ